MTEKKLAPRRFYMVCRDPIEVHQNNPKSVLYVLKAAQAKAEALAKETGHKYYILTPIMMVQPTTPPVEWTVME